MAAVEAAEQFGEQVGTVVLAFAVCVVVLGLQGGLEFDAGLEEGAGLTDVLEGAVEFGWSGAVAVAEVSVVFAA